MPPECEKDLGVDPIDSNLEGQAFVWLLSLRHFGVHARRDNGSAQERTNCKRAIELHAEPRAEFLSLGERPPDAASRGVKKTVLSMRSITVT
jgi:hypothetical protein